MSYFYLYIIQQFMRPRARDKKFLEEWVTPLTNLDDIHEVYLSLQNVLWHFSVLLN